MITELEIETSVGPVTVAATWQWVDNGIGAYEYWGAPGNDVNWQPEVESFEVLSEIQLTDDLKGEIEGLLEESKVLEKLGLEHPRYPDCEPEDCHFPED